MDFMQIIQAYGPYAALIIFFVWRDYIREQRLSKRLNEVEDFQKNELTTLVRTTVEAINANTRALSDLRNQFALTPVLKRVIQNGGKEKE